MELFNDNVRLVYMIANKMNFGECDKEDLVQVGLMGLYQASLKYNEKLGHTFSTFAIPYIVGEIKKELRENRLIKLNRNVFKVIKELNETTETSIECISKKLNVSKDIIMNALIYKDRCVSLNLVNNDEELISIVKSNFTKINEDTDLQKIINNLPKKERKIIILKYYEGYTQQQIGKLLGISQVKVSRTEKKILQKIRNIKKSSII